MSGEHVGFDSKEHEWESVDDMWEKNTSGRKGEEWYNFNERYWNGNASWLGVLGGLKQNHLPDMITSSEFLEELDLKCERVLDAGAGVGRVAESLLLPRFKCVDLLERCREMVEISREKLQKHRNIGEFYCSSLQDFNPSHKYDIIWFQWVCENVTDEDLTKILKRFKKALTPTGTIILKENVTRGCSGFYLDYEDNTITRTREQYIEIFTDAKLNIFKTKEVTDSFEKGLFPIMIWAMR